MLHVRPTDRAEGPIPLRGAYRERGSPHRPVIADAAEPKMPKMNGRQFFSIVEPKKGNITGRTPGDSHPLAARRADSPTCLDLATAARLPLFLKFPGGGDQGSVGAFGPAPALARRDPAGSGSFHGAAQPDHRVFDHGRAEIGGKRDVGVARLVQAVQRRTRT